MNRLGMLVDISHVSHKTMRDVIATTKAPLFFSHTSAAAICNTTRNAPDDVLFAMKKLDGVIMVNFWPTLISCQITATLEQVADHIGMLL
jgi:membrane dipeptidase